MTYDAARSRIVLVGGTAGLSHADTWEWDGSNWAQRTATNNPPWRWGHAIAYDAERRRVVLFGGFPSSADTWEWDGVGWTQRFPSNSPAARSGHTLAYHAARRRVVLFGGQSAGPPYIPLGDTWEWNGNDWSRSGGSPTDPPPRVGHGMTYDVARARLVLFGGGDNRGLSSEIWEWDGAWTLRVPSSMPTARSGAALAYDTARAKVVMFGGADSVPLSDLWEYSPVTPATYEVFGTGCVGSSGTPRLSGTAPYLGLPMSHEIHGLRAGQPGVLFFGDSDRAWGPILLPHDLASLGMPGCTLYVSGENLIPLSTATGTTRLTYTIPALAALEGLRCFNQHLSLDPSANPLGVTASNGGIGVCRWP